MATPVEQALATAEAAPEIGQLIRRTLDAARGGGFSLLRAPRTPLSDTMQLLATCGWPGSADAAAVYRDLIRSDAFGQVDPRVAARLRMATAPDPANMAMVRARTLERSLDLKGHRP